MGRAGRSLTMVAMAAVMATGMTVGSAAAAEKVISRATVAQHSTEKDCWSVIHSGVYNLTRYIPVHPGGKAEVVSLCGKNGTRAFNAQHMGERKVASVLAAYRIGKAGR